MQYMSLKAKWSALFSCWYQKKNSKTVQQIIPKSWQVINLPAERSLRKLPPEDRKDVGGKNHMCRVADIKIVILLPAQTSYFILVKMGDRTMLWSHLYQTWIYNVMWSGNRAEREQLESSTFLGNCCFWKIVEVIRHQNGLLNFVFSMKLPTWSGEIENSNWLCWLMEIYNHTMSSLQEQAPYCGWQNGSSVDQTEAASCHSPPGRSQGGGTGDAGL